MRDIYDYIAQENPDVAARVVEGIYQKAQVLREFPDIGYHYDHRRESGIWVLLYGHYRIAYQHGESGDVVILGVFHGALDADKYLF